MASAQPGEQKLAHRETPHRVVCPQHSLAPTPADSQCHRPGRPALGACRVNQCHSELRTRQKPQHMHQSKKMEINSDSRLSTGVKKFHRARAGRDVTLRGQ